MELYIYDVNFNYCGFVDFADCHHIIWTENFYTADNFEIQLPYKAELMSILCVDRIIKKNGENKGMLIEYICITEKTINGRPAPVITVKGRGCECLLGRRIIAQNININDTVCNIARQAVINNVTSPAVSTRKIDFIQLGTFPNSDTIEQVMNGENLLEFITNLLTANKLGFYFLLDLSKKCMKFTIYNGTDRTVANLKKVEFSTLLDNFTQTEYYIDRTTQYNCCITRSGNDSDGNIHLSVPVEPVGVNRIELYKDCSDFDFSGCGSAGVGRILSAQAKAYISELRTNETFTGTIIDGIIYQYGDDYSVGDIILVSDSYEHKASKRLISMTEYYAGSKRILTPVFEDVWFNK